MEMIFEITNGGNIHEQPPNSLKQELIIKRKIRELQKKFVQAKGIWHRPEIVRLQKEINKLRRPLNITPLTSEEWQLWKVWYPEALVSGYIITGDELITIDFTSIPEIIRKKWAEWETNKMFEIIVARCTLKGDPEREFGLFGELNDEWYLLARWGFKTKLVDLKEVLVCLRKKERRMKWKGFGAVLFAALSIDLMIWSWDGFEGNLIFESSSKAWFGIVGLVGMIVSVLYFMFKMVDYPWLGKLPVLKK